MTHYRFQPESRACSHLKHLTAYLDACGKTLTAQLISNSTMIYSILNTLYALRPLTNEGSESYTTKAPNRIYKCCSWCKMRRLLYCLQVIVCIVEQIIRNTSKANSTKTKVLLYSTVLCTLSSPFPVFSLLIISRTTHTHTHSVTHTRRKFGSFPLQGE
jgi:hypothetical protein